MSAQHTAPVVLRHATASDLGTLAELAELDSMRLPAGPFLLAEVDGRAVAALSLSDGLALADPFLPTAELVGLLRTHGAARAAGERRRRMSLRRRRGVRPALAV